MEDEKVKKLAEMLKSQGLAASMYEAVEKARSILNIDISKSDEVEKDADRFTKEDYDIKEESEPLDDLMKDVGVDPEKVKLQEENKLDNLTGEISALKEDIKQAKQDPERIKGIKEELEKVGDEVTEIKEVKDADKEAAEAEEPEEKDDGFKEKKKAEEEDDGFKEEKKIDLSKLFGYKG